MTSGCFSQSALLLATDAGIASVTSPSPSGCYTASESVIIVIQNFGTNVISNVPVTVTMSGPLNQTISSNYALSIPVGGTASLAVGSVNMSVGGVYTFSAYTSYPGDANPNNDASVTTRTVSPVLNIAGPSNACLGNSVTLNVGGANTYTWSNGANTSSINATPSVTTIYSVAGTSTAGCTSAAFITVGIQNPTISTNGSSGCGNPVNGTLTANAFSPAVVNWYSSPTSTTVLGTGNNFTLSSGSTVTYYAEAQSFFPGSLFTTMAGGNSSSGNMFDVIALNTLTINGMSWHFNSNITTTVEIWYRSGSFVGFETSNAGWTLAYTTTLVPFGTGTLTPIPGTFAIVIPGGQQYGIYITTKGGSGINYTNGSLLENLYASNSDMQFYEGKGGAYFNVTNSPRIFNGIINYEKAGCSSPRVPATFSVVPGVTVTAATNATSVCQGASASFTAYGAINYSWSPAAGITPQGSATVTATPTANTIYTVTGSIPSCTQIGTTTLNLAIIQSPSLSITPSQTVAPGTVLSLTCGGAFTYSWSPGGSNNTNILISPTVTTIYTVTGASNQGCTSSITTTVTVGNVGIREYHSDSRVSLYPNPSAGSVNIILEDFFAAEFALFDVSGKIILKTKLTEKENLLDLSLLEKGIYLYKISAGQNASTHGKLVLGE
jgi:hypothetical protein